MRVALVIAGKELRQRMRDRTAFLIAFVAPVLLASLVTLAFGSEGFGPGDFHLVAPVADEDQSQLSKAFLTVLRSRDLKELITVKKAKSGADARELVEQGFNAAYVIPKGFQSRVQSGARAEVIVYRNAADPISGDVAEAIAAGFTEQVNASRLAVLTATRAGDSAFGPSPELIAAAARDRIPVQLVDSGASPVRDVSGANYFGPAMAIFFLFFTVGAGARSLIAEREQGTMPRILAAPAGRSAIVAGKALAMFVLGLLSMVSTYVFMGAIFGVDWGDPVAISVLTLGVVLSVMAVTALVQTLARTEQQAANYGQVAGMVFALLGGSFFPLFQMPKLIQRLSVLTPNGWAMRGLTDVAYDGAHLGDLGTNVAVLAGFVIVFGTLAAWRARRITLA